MSVQKPSSTPPDELMALPMVRALLRELLFKLSVQADEGRADHIDLRRLPLPVGALDALKTWLGRGEIEATVSALGITTIQETGVAGVWWVRYAKIGGETTGEHLEITPCPALLAADQGEIGSALEALRGRLMTLETSRGADSSPSANSR